MGYIRERSLSDGSKRFYAEVELKGAGPRLTATFNRKSDAKLSDSENSNRDALWKKPAYR